MSEPRWLTDDEERAWRAYRRLNRLLYARLAAELAEATDLSEPDYDVLSTLTDAPGNARRASDLADRLQWSTSRLAHHIGRMERRGLVRRKPCDADGRGAIVSVTHKGLRAIEHAAPVHVASVRRYFIDALSPAERRALERMAVAVADRLESPPQKQ